MTEDHSNHTIYIYPKEYESQQNQLWDHDHPNILTPIDAVEHFTKDDPTFPFLGERSFLPNGERGEYEWLSYSEVLSISQSLARSLKSLGLQKGDVIGFFSKRRLEWHYLFIACGYIGVKIVTLYESLTVESIKLIAQNAEIKRMFVSDEKLDVITKAIDCPITLIEDIHKDKIFGEKTKCVAEEIHYESNEKGLYELIDDGRKMKTELEKVKPDDVAILVYTSGTTGSPKGVALTYRNLAASSSSLWMRIPLGLIQQYPRRSKKLVSLSFLPLGHVFAIVMEFVLYRVGGSIGFMSSTHLKIVEDISVLKPVVFAAVPRVLQIIYNGINNIVAQKPKALQIAFNAAMKMKEQIVKYNPSAIIPTFDDLFFGEVRRRFGGNLRIIICAGAPLSLDIGKFFRLVVCDAFLIGYGMTETTGMGTSSTFEDGLDLDQAGTPYVSSMIKVKCVPEMGYCTHNKYPCGEVMIKTTAGFKGYHKDPNPALDSEGFITTNDIVHIREDKRIKIIARKNSVFKLSQGEYVSSEKIESMMTQCKYVQDIFVYGNSLKNYLIAVIVPNFQSIELWLKQNGKGEMSKEDICKNDEIKEVVLKEVGIVANQTGLKGFEKPKKLILHHIPFDTTRDLITPSMKLKRKNLYEYFKEDIEALLKD